MISSKSKSTLKIVTYSSFITNTDKNERRINTISTPTSQAISNHQNFSSKTEYEESSSRTSTKNQEQIQQSYMRCHNYFLRKSIMNLYKYFQNREISWNLDELTYQQMLLILKQLKYIKSVSEDTKAENNTQLRKAYYLWVNLAQGTYVKLSNILIILSHIEKLECDGDLIDEVIRQLKKGIQKFPNQNESLNPYPTFIFYCKKENWKFINGLVVLNVQQIQQVQKTFSCFLYTRLTQIDQKMNLEQSQKVQNSDQFMSKKSIELATTKRQRILEQIRQRQPQIECIQLHHILNYKEKQCPKKSKNHKTQGVQLFVAIKKGKQNKKQEGTNNLNKRKEEKLKLLQSANKDKEKLNSNKSTYFGKKKIKQKQVIANATNQCYQSQIWNKSSQLQKDQIVDELQWQQIPRKADDIAVQNDLFNLKPQIVNEAISPAQSNLLLSEESSLRQKKRRQYIDLPILYVDVNIEEGKKERIIIYEGDKASQLAIQFGQKHGLSQQTIGRLEGMLEQQIGSVLSKIDEAFQQDCSYLF